MDWLSDSEPCSEGKFEWQIFSQAREPIDPASKQWGLDYDLEASCRLLRERGISKGSIREHRLRVLFIQEGLRQGFSLDRLSEMSSIKTTSEKTVFEELVDLLHVKSSSSKSLDEEGSLALFKE